ncbi:glycosyltransferase family 1 protein [Rhizophagus irregularis DAOM 181602=DAOM 197198]|nr:glycosyltransferase family 1 protein [Rhizophagus irregularis DAOM 181602=DAOM 197198]
MWVKYSSTLNPIGADSIDDILYSSSLNEGVNEEFLKECVWIPADFRMGDLLKGIIRINSSPSLQQLEIKIRYSEGIHYRIL